jgi:hypothetical protein
VTRRLELACHASAAVCIAALAAGHRMAVVGLLGLFLAGSARRRPVSQTTKETTSSDAQELSS